MFKFALFALTSVVAFAQITPIPGGGGGGGGGTGTVTSVTCGTGLTGGTITVSGTCAIDTAVVPTKAAANTFAELQTLQKGANISSSTALAAAGDIRYNGGDLQFYDASGSSTVMKNPFTTRGDMVIQGASGPTRLAAGTSGYFLMANGAAADPSYQIPNASQVTNAFDKSTTNSLGANYFDMAEQAAPSSPGANVARMYSKDNGSGTTQVCYKDSAAAEVCIGSVSGIVPVANGGTGLPSGTSGGILAYTAPGTLASSGALASGAVMVGGGAGAAPATRSGLTVSSENALTAAITAQAGMREPILSATVSDASGAGFVLGNGTLTDNAFGAALVGRSEGSTRAGMVFRGLTTVANDTGTTSLTSFQSMTNDGDILNGTLGTPTNRPGYSFTYGSSGVLTLQMESSGQWNMGNTAYNGKVTNVDLGLFDVTATTGVTREIIQAGQGQSTSALTEWRDYHATLGSGTLGMSITKEGRIVFASQNESTGAGTPLFGTNSPAVTNTNPYTWLEFTTSDGSTVFVPAWK